MIDQSIIAHGAHKRNLVPFANHSITYIVHMLVADTIEVISLITHVAQSSDLQRPSLPQQ